MSHFDVIIIGSGPAGLFAAWTIAQKNKYKIAIIDRTKQSSGGMANDGKLNFHTKVGMNLSDLQLSENEALKKMDMILQLFLQTGYMKEVTSLENDEYDFWKKRVQYHNSELIIPRQFHYGTDNAKAVIEWFKTRLSDMGVEFILETKINEWKENNETFTGKKTPAFILNGRKNVLNVTFTCNYLVMAPGRWGAYQCKTQAVANGVETSFGPIDIGIRVEMNADFYKPIVDNIYDPKIILGQKRNVRTFCTNPNGRVRTETYDEFNLVNGDALANDKTKNTNFALLRTVRLTEPLVDTTLFARTVANQFHLMTNGKVLVQRVSNLREGRRSRERDLYDPLFYADVCEPTLTDVVPGDVTLGFPAKIWYDLWKSLKILDKICPGVLHPSTLIYAPEIKFYDTQYKTNQYCETNVSRLYMIGDGCGKSRGIVGAALSGMLAGEGIIKDA